MFVFNLKLNKSKIFKIIIILLIIIAISILIVSIFNLSKEVLNYNKNYITDSVQNDIAILTPQNYTNVLKQVHENIDDYIGQKISFTGYVYRLKDLEENEFVLARNMIINNQNQYLVVGFLCKYENANSIKDGTWINITGTIEKGFYLGDIPCINIDRLEETSKPEDEFVYPPDDFYIPTSVIY